MSAIRIVECTWSLRGHIKLVFTWKNTLLVSGNSRGATGMNGVWMNVSAITGKRKYSYFHWRRFLFIVLFTHKCRNVLWAADYDINKCLIAIRANGEIMEICSRSTCHGTKILYLTSQPISSCSRISNRVVLDEF